MFIWTRRPAASMAMSTACARSSASAGRLRRRPLPLGSLDRLGDGLLAGLDHLEDGPPGELAEHHDEQREGDERPEAEREVDVGETCGEEHLLFLRETGGLVSQAPVRRSRVRS